MNDATRQLVDDLRERAGELQHETLDLSRGGRFTAELLTEAADELERLVSQRKRR